jgi:hypothetical protein
LPRDCITQERYARLIGARLVETGNIFLSTTALHDVAKETCRISSTPGFPRHNHLCGDSQARAVYKDAKPVSMGQIIPLESILRLSTAFQSVCHLLQKLTPGLGTAESRWDHFRVSLQIQRHPEEADEDLIDSDVILARLHDLCNLLRPSMLRYIDSWSPSLSHHHGHVRVFHMSDVNHSFVRTILHIKCGCK